MTKRLILAVLSVLIFTGLVEAKVVTETVSYEQGGAELQGYLAYDDSIKGRRPGVLVVHEWWGLNDYARKRVEQLAGMGYVAFGLDMYGKGRVTKHPDQAGEWMKEVNSNVEDWRQRALAGLEVLRKDSRTDRERIAAIGYCFGGATVQQLAYGQAPVKGVVSFHGALVSPPQGVSSKAVEAKILICHGAADPFLKEGTVESYMAAMEQSGLDWQLIIYGGAKHSFTNPNADAKKLEALAYSPSADERSWGHLKLFFDELFERH
jgi:dienelactone hydrolase